MFITYKSEFGQSAFGSEHAAGRRRWTVLVFAAGLAACGSSDSPQRSDGGAAEVTQNERGELLSYACLACHSLEAGGEHQIGPNLHGVFGRVAGTAPDFAYSSALIESGIVWTPEEIDRWLADPTGFLPGTSMAFTGYQQPRDREALIEYLVEVTGP
ncbi:MAG: c-type cytochrome [Gammaproteobacteria bacterium]